MRFSLALDDGFTCEEATTTVATRIKRKWLPWLRDDTSVEQGD